MTRNREALRRLPLMILAVGLLLLGGTRAAWAQKPIVWDFGTYPGGTWAEPRGVNNSGVVVGYGDIPSGYTRPIGVPVLGPDALQWFDLGTLGGDHADSLVMCMGIADSGMIVGHAYVADNIYVHAFAWTPKSGMVDIGTLGANTFSLAYNVNRAGTLIVGWSGPEWMNWPSRPVVWTPMTVKGPQGPVQTWAIQELDTTGFEDATYWMATAVNNSGQIVGSAVTADGVEFAVLWNPMPGRTAWKIQRLPALASYPHAWPDDINDQGQIVGGLASPDGDTSLPALWQPVAPQMKTWDLTVLPFLSDAYVFTEAMGISDRGDIVGYSWDVNYLGPATRWSAKDMTIVQSLESLGFPTAGWSWALKVSNSGIVAGGYGPDSNAWEHIAAMRLR
jgi:probable HAF family extracellular repeat protein